MTDLASFCKALQATSKDSAILNAAKGVIDALKPGKYVIAEGHLGPKVEDCAGVSIYLPSPANSRISPYYKDLESAKRHKWDELLRDYFRAVQT